MNDCLSLPLRQGSGGIRALGGWECCWLPLGEGEAEGLPRGLGAGWEQVEVPLQLWASEGRQAVWYRTSFPRPDHTGRVVLRIGGAFLAANVWLNGRLLGSHYGYFAPFGFDLTSHLRSENLLVICCESPIERDLSRKRHVMGFFNDGDTRPYPGSALFSLPEPYRWEVPLGLWRPVELEYMGPVALDWLRLTPWLEGDVGRLEVEARLRNLDGREMEGELALEVAGRAAQPLRLRREYVLPGGLEQTLSMTLSVPGALRWSPWRLGEPVLHRALATVLVGDQESVRVEEDFGFRDVRLRPGHDAWEIRVNGQPMFLRGANYQPGLRLDQLDSERFDADLALAREANLDALRVHAHVLPEEFYRRADAAGMLVLADFPLTLAYAYHASGEEARFFETAVREQVPEMVELLRNRPSVVMWIAHDDPPWIPANSELADVHAVRQNYTIDQEAKALFERLDPTRPVLAASGELDGHLYLGWRHGPWQAFADLEPTFASEFGAQAPPDVRSPVWDRIGRRWPVADDEPDWLYAGFQILPWAESGVGLPSDFEDLETLVARSQAYQSWLIRFALDQLRRRKFEPCWGAFVYQLVDTFPGIGFGVLDSSRLPKPAFSALREAMALTRVIVEPVGFEPLQPYGVGYRPGGSADVRLIVVNDDPNLHGGASVRWSVSRERAREQPALSWLRDALRRKSFSGAVDFALPTAQEPALQLTSLGLPLDAEGEYRLDVELSVAGRTLGRSWLDFLVSEELPVSRRRPLIPPLIAEHIAELSSLASHPVGLRFTLLNRTRPAVLTRLQDLRLDGAPVTGARVLVETSSGRVPLPRRLDLAVGRPVGVQVELPEPLEPGGHELEVDVTVPGVASGRLRLRGGGG